ncbi:MAG: ribosomal protein S18-alanine N-acetyltransferase [Eubacteriales bacterium]|nr:ribosomal protein S18-alanine N-acetyltransferase [Eubacteriales bacterium]
MFDIRPATIADAKSIADIENRCFPSPWSLKQIEEDISSPQTKYFLAVCDGVICGYTGMWNVLDEGSITNIAVLEEYRRKGIARALLNALLSCNVAYVTLEVRRSNASAICLYKKFNFQILGTRKDYYSNPDSTKEDAYIMAWKLMKDKQRI